MFTVSSGGTQLGSPVTSGTGDERSRQRENVLPASAAAGSYTITAVYNAEGGEAEQQRQHSFSNGYSDG